MRVTVINFYGKGGMLYYATELANALTPRCDVRLVLPRKYPGFYRGLNDRVELVQVVVPEDFSRRNLVRLPVYATAFPVLVKRILEGRPDIVHVTNENIWLTGLAPFIGNHRLVWTLHDPIPHLGDSIRKKSQRGYWHALAGEFLYITSTILKWPKARAMIPQNWS